MKIMAISDLHNDVPYTKLALEVFQKEKYDKLYVLGDILCDCIDVLNPFASKIVAVMGNCDSYDEEDLARFPLPLINYDSQFGKFIILTHGNYYNEWNLDQPYDILFTGHTHISRIFKTREGKILANPGSLAEPRDGYHSYLSFDEKGMKVIDINSKEVVHFLDF